MHYIQRLIKKFTSMGTNLHQENTWSKSEQCDIGRGLPFSCNLIFTEPLKIKNL